MVRGYFSLKTEVIAHVDKFPGMKQTMGRVNFIVFSKMVFFTNFEIIKSNYSRMMTYINNEEH